MSAAKFRIRVRENWYRDVWLILITALMVWAVNTNYHNAIEAKRVSHATCAATAAVIDAGRQTLRAGSVVKPDAFRKALEQLGLPQQHIRIIQANAAARNYGRTIARAVERATGRHGLARPDGSLDCSRF